MENINVEVKLNQKINVDVNLNDVIDAINDCELATRWNIIGKIINDIQLSLNELTEEQRIILKKYLQDKLSLF